MMDDSAQILQDCQKKGIKILPIMTKFESHGWHEGKNFKSCQEAVEHLLSKEPWKRYCMESLQTGKAPSNRVPIFWIPLEIEVPLEIGMPLEIEMPPQQWEMDDFKPS